MVGMWKDENLLVLFQAEAQSNMLKAQASMMATVACAAVPKITLVIGGSFGTDSYVMVRERSCVPDTLQTHPCSILHPSLCDGLRSGCALRFCCSVGDRSAQTSCSCGPTRELLWWTQDISPQSCELGTVTAQETTNQS